MKVRNLLNMECIEAIKDINVKERDVEKPLLAIFIINLDILKNLKINGKNILNF